MIATVFITMHFRKIILLWENDLEEEKRQNKLEHCCHPNYSAGVCSGLNLRIVGKDGKSYMALKACQRPHL